MLMHYLPDELMVRGHGAKEGCPSESFDEDQLSSQTDSSKQTVHCSKFALAFQFVSDLCLSILYGVAKLLWRMGLSTDRPTGCWLGVRLVP